MKNKYLILIMLSLFLALSGCSSVSGNDSESIEPDLPLDSQVVEPVDSNVIVNHYSMNLHAIKGPFDDRSKFYISIPDLLDTVIDVGDFSRANFVFADTVKGLSKSTNSKLAKIEVRGRALSEASGKMLQTTLVGYFNVDSDSNIINLNFIHNLISAKVDDGVGLEEAERIVLDTLGLGSDFNYNISWDDSANVFEAGRMLGVAVIMTDSEYKLLPELYDITTYNTLIHYATLENKHERFDAMMVFSDDSLFTTQHRMVNNACQQAKDIMDTTAYRNITLYGISDELVSGCEEYVSEVFYRSVDRYFAKP